MDYLGVVLIVATVAAAFVVIARNLAWHGRQAKAEQQRQLTLAKRAAEADVSGFGEELGRLACGAEVDAVCADEYDRAVLLHQRAVAALGASQRPDDLCLVTEILEEARWTTARLVARAAGEPMPSRRPPCFFNPGHGPSVRNIGWHERNVPACAADAARVEAGADPYIRTVERDDLRVPYWEGGPGYAGWAQGYFKSWHGSRLVADIQSGKA